MFNYYKVEETGDLRYLYKLDDYEELPESNTDHLATVWDDMRLEVEQIVVDNNPQSANVFDKAQTLAQRKSDYDVIQLLLPRLWDVKNDEYIKALSDLGYKINPKRDYHMEIKRISKQSQLLLTKIKLLELEYNELTKVTGKKSTIYDEISSVERYINQIGSIDMHKMTMRSWLTLKHRINNEATKKSIKK